MKLLELLDRESTLSLRILVVMAGIAGISNAAILAVINTAAAQAAQDIYSFRHFTMFLILLALYILAQRYLLLTSAAEVEKVIGRVRVRMADKIRHCDLLTLEKIGHSDIYACVSKETLTISQSVTMLVVGAQSAMLVFCTAFYIAWLSLTTFILVSLVNISGASFYLKQRQKLNEDLHKTAIQENQFFDSITDILDGFKEVRINRARSADLFAHIQEISASATALKIGTEMQNASNFILTQVVFYLLLATVVFIAPRFSPTYSEIVMAATTAVLFVFGPIGNVVGAIPVLARANASCENIAALEERLDQGVDRAVTVVPPLTSFREINLHGVCFYYTEQTAASAFSVGPLNLTITAGEKLFVAGGNGSGKSTFMKLLTGLYRPLGGVIRVDGVPLSEANVDAYRQLFSVIFSDYHLFKRLYGLQQIDPARVQALLEAMQLEKKTRFANGEFQTLDLSTGQKKRLALLVALLEDKPIYVFDEWAADQDPQFRKKFYEELLPQLKASGKTIVAVTHDDRYYHLADRILKMEEGQIVESLAGSAQGG